LVEESDFREHPQGELHGFFPPAGGKKVSRGLSERIAGRANGPLKSASEAKRAITNLI